MQDEAESIGVCLYNIWENEAVLFHPTDHEVLSDTVLEMSATSIEVQKDGLDPCSGHLKVYITNNYIQIRKEYYILALS